MIFLNPFTKYEYFLSEKHVEIKYTWDISSGGKIYSCFLIDEIEEWLMSNRSGIFKSKETYFHEIKEILKVYKPRIIFKSKNHAMIFKLIWG